MEKIEIDQNFEIGNLTIEFATKPDGVSDTEMNVTIDLHKWIEQLQYDVTFNMPESHDDTRYMKEILRTKFNVTRIFDGIKGNSVMRIFMDSILKSIKTEKVEFPLTPRVYRFVNLSFSGKHLPPISTKFLVQSKIFVKTNDSKKMVQSCIMRSYCNLNW